jgi:hypothetical protein
MRGRMKSAQRNSLKGALSNPLERPCQRAKGIVDEVVHRSRHTVVGTPPALIVEWMSAVAAFIPTTHLPRPAGFPQGSRHFFVFWGLIETNSGLHLIRTTT